MIITLRIKLDTYWSADMEVNELSTLEEVHLAIQRAVGFDNDHLYEFFVASSPTARNRRVFDDENEGLYTTRIGEIFPLPAKHHLFYLFDYGDSWLFRLEKTRKSPHEPIDGVVYPRVISETGEKPVQYRSEDDY